MTTTTKTWRKDTMLMTPTGWRQLRVEALMSGATTLKTYHPLADNTEVQEILSLVPMQWANGSDGNPGSAWLEVPEGEYAEVGRIARRCCSLSKCGKAAPSLLRHIPGTHTYPTRTVDSSSTYIFLNSRPAGCTGGDLIIDDHTIAPTPGMAVLLQGASASVHVTTPVGWTQFMLECRLWDAVAAPLRRNTGPEDMQIVSLGSYCGMKMSMMAAGYGGEYLPFDWIRSSMEGVLHFLRSDFEGYFDYDTVKPVPSMEVTMFRSRYHSFWHHDILDPAVREKLQRRMDRFRGMRDAQRTKPMVFLRHVACTTELPQTEELFEELQAQFGSEIFLVLVLSKQSVEGPILHGGNPRIVFYPTRDHAVDSGAAAPFVPAVQFAVDYVRHRHDVGRQLPCPLNPVASGAELMGLMRYDDFACTGFDDLAAFEPVQDAKEARPAAAAAPVLRAEERKPVVVPGTPATVTPTLSPRSDSLSGSSGSVGRAVFRGGAVVPPSPAGAGLFREGLVVPPSPAGARMFREAAPTSPRRVLPRVLSGRPVPGPVKPVAVGAVRPLPVGAVRPLIVQRVGRPVPGPLRMPVVTRVA